MPNQLPAAVLWDMDGTLVDSEPYWMISQSRLASEYGASWGHEEGLGLVGKSLYDSSAIIRDHLDIQHMSIEQIIDRLTNEVVEQLREKLHWRPGALDLLIELKQAGVKTALVTMSMRRMALAVVEQVPFHAFDVVVAGDDVTKGKPHPEPYLKAAELLGVSPEMCIALEDSHTGLTSAESAGTFAIGIPSVAPIPSRAGRNLLETLEGINLEKLVELRSNANR
jgi:HAD superfamily hydrolase (TIGR01509 family)